MPSTISSLLVDLQVNSAALRRGLDAAGGNVKSFGAKVSDISKSIEGVAQQMEKLGKKSAVLGAAITGAAALALRSAAQHNKQVAVEVEKVKDAFGQLAAEVAKAVLPVVREFSSAVLSLVGWIRSMDPATKASVVHWVRMGAEVLAVTAVVGKLAEGIGMIARVASLVGGFLSSGIIIPMVAIGGIIAGIITIVGLFSQAWKAFGDDITYVLKGVWEMVKGVFSKIAEIIGKVFSFIADAIAKLLKAAGLDDAASSVAAKISENLKGQWEGFKSIFGAIGDFGVSTGRSLKKGFLDGLDALGIRGVIDSVMGAFSGHQAAISHVPVSQLRGSAIQNEAAMGALAKGAINANTYRVGGGRYAANRISATNSTGNTDSSAAANDRLANAANHAAAALANEFVPKMGKLSTVITAATGDFAKRIGDMAQGAGMGAEAGGVIGAIVGILASLLGESTGFITLIDMVSGIVQTLADGLGAILDPVSLLVASLMPLAHALSMLFAPIGTVVSMLTKQFIPVITVIGLSFQALAPILQMLSGPLAAMMFVIQGPLIITLKLLFEAFKFLGLTALEFVRWVAGGWASIVNAVAGILDSLRNYQVKIAGAVIKPFESIGGLSDALKDSVPDISALNDQINVLQNLTYDQADAMAENTVAQLKQKDAVDKATAAFLNVPSGYRVALARYNATNAGAAASGAAVEGQAMLPPVQVTFNVESNQSPEELVGAIEQLLRDKDYIRRGRFGKKLRTP
jgi:phage-related minor tail protein